METLDETLIQKWVAVSLRALQAQGLIKQGRLSDACEKLEWVIKASREAIEKIRKHEREMLDGLEILPRR
jgi:hypothetical protein